MKKWIVLIVAALMGLMLALQYLTKRNAVEQAGPGSAQDSGGAGGVSLPPEAASLSGLPSGSPVAAGDFYVEAACKGGSITEILEAQGKTWGSLADAAVYPVIKGADMDKVSSALGDYFTCMALSVRDSKACDNAPDSSGTKKSSPRWECTAVLHDILAAAYMSGKQGEISSCMWLISEISEDYPDSGISRLTPGQFCPVAAKGMENICSSFPSLGKDCKKIFPAAGSDCGGDEDCLNRYALYNGIKSGNPQKCPSEDRAYCEVFLAKSRVSCTSHGEKASKLYCSYLEKARANSPQAIKEKREAEQRAEQEKLDQQKTVENINKEIKKILQKK